jgi:uncharacterized protein YkwD
MLRLGAVTVGNRTAATLNRAASVLSFKLVARPHARRRWACWTGAVCAALIGASTSAGAARAASDGTDADAVGTACRGAETQALEAPSGAVRALRCVVNQVRRDRALPILRRRWRLDEAASRHVEDMVAREYFSHTSPGGATIVDRVRRSGYLEPGRAWRLGETLAWGTGSRSTPAAVVRAWLHSPRHGALLLDARFRDVGIGVAGGVPVELDGPAPGATFGLVLGVLGR